MDIKIKSRDVFKSSVIDISIQISSESELNNLRRDISDLHRGSSLVVMGADKPIGHRLLIALMEEITKLEGNNYGPETKITI